MKILMWLSAISSLYFIVIGRLKSLHLTEGEALIYFWEYWLAAVMCSLISIFIAMRDGKDNN